MKSGFLKYLQLTGMLSCLVFLCQGLYGQEKFHRRNFNTSHGMSHDYVQSITQDKTGFLWVATWDGVCRFNGYEFRNYHHQPDETNTLPFFAVDKIISDSLNNVWALTMGRALTRYDRAGDRFVRELTCNGEELVVDDITLCSRSEVWVVHAGGLKRYDPASGKATAYRMIDPETGQLFRFDFLPQIAQDNRGTIWIAGHHAHEFLIFRGEWSPDSALRLHPFPPVPIALFPSSGLRNYNLNLDICQTNPGDIWLFSVYGLYRYHPGEKSFVKHNSPPAPETFSGKPWYSWCDDNDGSFLINTSPGKLIHIPSENGNFITAVFRDREGNIWNGELNDFRENIGLNRYSPIPEYFRHSLTGKNDQGNNHLVFPVLQLNNGEIIVGTRHSDPLFRIGPDGVISEMTIPRGSDGEHPRIRTMARDSAGIWMGGTGNLLMHYDFSSGNFHTISLKAKGKTGGEPDLNIHTILSRSDRLVINGSEGIYLYTPGDDSLTLVFPFGNRESGFTLAEDGQGGYWIGVHNNTVIHLNREFSEVGRYAPGKGLNNVEHICRGDSADIWVALMGGGLGHVRPQTGETEIYTTADGLPNNTLYSIVKDRRGELWISTNQGISRFSPKTRFFRNFGKEDGLMIREFNSDSWFQSPEGWISFGGIGGLVTFHPDSIHEISGDTGEGHLIVEAFSVSGIRRNFSKAVYEMDTLVLNKGDNNFQATFASLHLSHPEKMRYRYRLNGGNGNWSETDYLHRNINFVNLSPGKYLLEVESTNLGGSWKTAQKLVVRIPAYFYQTVWFRFLGAGLVLGILSLVAWMTIRQILLRAKHLQDELRLESLRGQMNPHFIFNSLNSINYFISNNDKLLANQYISDFSRLIRSILENMTSSYIPLAEEIGSLKEYLKLEHLRFNDKFDYSLESDTGDDLPQLMVFPGMVQPFVENAIWHGIRNLEGRTGFIKIVFSLKSRNAVVCVIEDDGVGRKLSHQLRNVSGDRRSRGISIVTERLRILNNLRKTDLKLQIEDLYPGQTETGTRVVIDIPVRASEPKD